MTTQTRDMPQRLTKERLTVLRSSGLAHCTWTDVITLKEGSDALEPTVVETLNAYFAIFATPQVNCVACDARLIGNLAEQALGLATLEWGIVHGEARCSRCGWPSRVYHRNVGPIKFLNAALQYHPDGIKWRDES